MKRLFLPAALLALSFSTAMSQTSVSAATVPAGFLKVTILAGSSGTAKLTSFSLPLREPVESNFQGVAAGGISGATSNTLTVVGAGWLPGALSQASAPYFLRIKSGAAEGRTFQVSTSGTAQNTADTVTLLTEGSDLSAVGVVQGVKFEIFPADTLLSLFGSGTSDGIGSVLGGTPATGDLVRVMEGPGWSEYHFNAVGNQWRRGSVPISMNNVVLRPDRGLLYVRRAQSPLELSLTGVVPDTNLKMVYNTLGGTFLATGFPIDRTLAQLAYQALPGWVAKTGSNSIDNADKVQIFDGVAWNQFHFDEVIGQWRRGSVPVNMNGTIVKAGTPILIEKRSGTQGTAFIERSLPYSVN